MSASTAIAGLMKGFDFTTAAGIAYATQMLNLQMAADAYDKAVQAAELKKYAMEAALDSMAEKMASATFTRAAKAMDQYNQL